VIAGEKGVDGTVQVHFATVMPTSTVGVEEGTKALVLVEHEIVEQAVDALHLEHAR
jgi:hypothetical protein